METVYLIKNILFFTIGIIIGESIPDLDQKTKWLNHRSKLTHLPVIHFALAYAVSEESLRGGILMGYAIHIILDLFPRKWKGFSMIKPFGKTATIWLLTLSLSTTMVTIASTSKVCVSVAVITFLFKMRNERHKWYGKMIFMGISLLVLFTLNPKVYF